METACRQSRNASVGLVQLVGIHLHLGASINVEAGRRIFGSVRQRPDAGQECAGRGN